MQVQENALVKRSKAPPISLDPMERKGREDPTSPAGSLSSAERLPRPFTASLSKHQNGGRNRVDVLAGREADAPFRMSTELARLDNIENSAEEALH